MGAEPVLDQEFIRFLLQLGVGGVIAGILFFFYRKDVRQFTDLWREQAKLNSEQTAAMIAVVKENTIAFTQNTEIARSLHKRIDRLELLRIVTDEEEKDIRARLSQGREQRAREGRQ